MSDHLESRLRRHLADLDNVAVVNETAVNRATRAASKRLRRRRQTAIGLTSAVLVVLGNRDTGNGEFAHADGAAYNPATDSWRSITSGPGHPGFIPLWTGTHMLMFAKGGVSVYDGASDVWIDTCCSNANGGETPVWTGTVALLFGGGQTTAGGSAFTPPSPSIASPETCTDPDVDVATEPDWRQFADYREWTRDGCLVRMDVLADRPQPADASLIPDFSHLDEDAPGVVSKRDWMVIDVDYRLMADNLLDLSHVNYLHDGLLGNAELVSANVDIHQDGDTLYVTRTSHSVTPPLMFDLMYRNDSKPVDTWAEMRWDAPGYLRNHAGVTQPGKSRESGMTVIGSHLLTPINATQMRYHIAAVQLGGPPPGETDDEIAERLSTLRRFAFEEQDRPMVEAQQQAYDRAGGPDNLKPIMLSIDAGPLRARRILDRKIAEEAAPVGVVVAVVVGGRQPSPV